MSIAGDCSSNYCATRLCSALCMWYLHAYFNSKPVLLVQLASAQTGQSYSLAE